MYATTTTTTTALATSNCGNKWDSLIKSNTSLENFNTLSGNYFICDANDLVIKSSFNYNLTVMPAIKDVKVIEDKVVFVTFADGTTEKAVLCPDDTFSLEQGISICITKKLLSDKTKGRGSSTYNKLVKSGLKVYRNKMKSEQEKQQKAEEEKARRARIAEKKKRKRERREAMKREQEIEIQKEAYVRAMKELNSGDEVHG